ncbi:YopX family protein [Streptococcus salivarius]|uniref:YopX family protein n=1 Tax=Streptococcus salivarius TaxID=1304 RepID=UPI0015D159D1|nr:YopX family protein [Streptococcus salivarius]
MIPRFRAWDKIHKTMYEVDDIMSIDFGKSEICVKTLFFEQTNRYKFDDIVLMQSTGMRDKNDREIFEGDVVKMAKNVYSEPTNYEIVRHRSGAHRLESKRHGCELWLRHTDCEIAGNIYKNPELLEEQDQ